MYGPVVRRGAMALKLSERPQYEAKFPSTRESAGIVLKSERGRRTQAGYRTLDRDEQPRRTVDVRVPTGY